MPIPYSVIYQAALSTFGVGATPGQVQAGGLVATLSGSNIAPITLTGLFQTVAVVAPAFVFTGAEKVILSGEVAVDNPGPGFSGQIQIELQEDAVVIGVPIKQSFPADGTGASAKWSVELNPGAGSHSFRVRALATGDSAGTIQVGNAQLQVIITKV